ncbi:MAG: MBOAT family O-acyltransferase [Eubacteriales bacterium]|nr:MBOAT family protein [Clostridiales bacterium]MDY2769035.1 MBOAT family O-acyltransferase [Eubacteriales bacterium]
MVFSSLTFLTCFFPIVLALYFVKGSIRWRNGVLLAASLVFYAWGEPIWIVAMLASTLVNWVCAGMISVCRGDAAKRGWMIAGVGFAGALLFVFKYTAFFANSFLSLFGAEARVAGLKLPIGISFYTFQIISYTVDVYRGETPAQRSFARLLLYVSCFPQLIAGPIVQYSDVAKQIGSRKTTAKDFTRGMQRFVVGLGKKVIFANICGLILRDLPLADAGAMSFGGAWYAGFVYMLQVYFDFSGYSDMAIGIGRILGFTYKENFDYPFIAKDVSEYWHRWHISLSMWFRDYLLYPILRSRGMRRLSMKKSERHGRMYYRNLATMIATTCVWAFTGLWHGASWNFIVWGLYFCVLQLLEKFALGKVREKLPAIACWAINLILIVVSFVIFYYTDMGLVTRHISAMLGVGSAGFIDARSRLVIRTYSFFPLLAFVCSMPIAPMLNRLGRGLLGSKAFEIVKSVALSACVALAVLFLVGQSYNPFIYFQF